MSHSTILELTLHPLQYSALDVVLQKCYQLTVVLGLTRVISAGQGSRLILWDFKQSFFAEAVLSYQQVKTNFLTLKIYWLPSVQMWYRLCFIHLHIIFFKISWGPREQQSLLHNKQEEIKIAYCYGSNCVLLHDMHIYGSLNRITMVYLWLFPPQK